MLHLPRIFILLFLGGLTTVQSECGVWSTLKFQFKCKSTLTKFTEYAENHINVGKDYMHMAQLCDNAVDCLSKINCVDMNLLQTQMTPICERTRYSDPDNVLCLKQFFKKAYFAQFSKEETCLRDYSFADKDNNKRKQAFTNGKLCFIKFVKDHCTSSSVRFFDSNHYQKFLNSVSTDGARTSCDQPIQNLESIRFNILIEEYNSKVDEMNIMENRSNRTFMADSLKLCRDIAASKANRCFFHRADEIETEKQCHNLEL